MVTILLFVLMFLFCFTKIWILFYNIYIMKYIKSFNQTLENYSTVANTFRGLRPSIKNLAILTAQNPHGEQHSNEFNKSANKDLEALLSKYKLGYKKVKGSYGQKEKSFIVFNIPYAVAIEIGTRFNQDSIIYGEIKDKQSYDDDESMLFKIIGTDQSKPEEYRKVLDETSVFVSRDNADDFYSEIKGRKFILPFYDVIDQSDNIKKSYTGSKWRGGKAEPTVTTTYKVPDWLLKWVEEHERKHLMLQNSKKPFIRK
jgi:hypothetical protein